MGRYDNYSNIKNIEKARKRLNKLMTKRNQDPYQIELARRELETAQLFEHCQIFGREDFLKNGNNPNATIMFNDDNRVMMFVDKLIRYDDIKSYCFLENRMTKAYTTTEKKGTLSRAIVGGMIAGGVGALVGATSAGSQSNTTIRDEINGFILQISLKNGECWYCCIQDVFGDALKKLPKKWLELGTKLQMIIDGTV